MKPVVRPCAASLAALACLSFLTPTRADWTHYRGSNHDGTYTGSIRTNWTAEAPRLLWRIPMGAALSSLTIQGGRVFTQARRADGGQDREFAVALDAATGKELWMANLGVADYPNGGVGDDDGPRSTPVLDGDRVYVLTSYLRLFCLEAATGREIWRRDFPVELGAPVIAWQNAASPLLQGDLILLNANAGNRRLMAVRKSDGTTAWQAHDEAMTQSTPVAADLAGVPQVVFFTQTGLVSVRPANGALLWRFPLWNATSIAASPVAAGDLVYGSAAYSSGSGVVRVAPTAQGAQATEVWKRRGANQNHWATPVYHDGYLYGVYGSGELSLRCVEAATGTNTWRSQDDWRQPDYIGFGSVLKAGGFLLTLSASGRVGLSALDPTRHREIDHFQAFTRSPKCWNNPALDNGILYARSTLEVAAFDLSPSAPPPPPPPLRLAPSLALSSDGVGIQVSSEDGSAIPTARAAGLRLLAADDPQLPVAGWQSIPGSPRVAEGKVHLLDPRPPVEPRRYYRVEERP